MKNISLVLGILIYLHISYMVYLNKGQHLSLAIYEGGKVFSLNTESILPIFVLYSALGMLLISFSYSLIIKTKLKKQLRTTEKASISTQESQDKVKNLQAKIATLEVALNEALKK